MRPRSWHKRSRIENACGVADRSRSRGGPARSIAAELAAFDRGRTCVARETNAPAKAVEPPFSGITIRHIAATPAIAMPSANDARRHARFVRRCSSPTGLRKRVAAMIVLRPAGGGFRTYHVLHAESCFAQSVHQHGFAADPAPCAGEDAGVSNHLTCSPTVPPKECPVCKTVFNPHRSKQVCCSQACRYERARWAK